MREQPLQTAQIQTILRQSLRALQYLHYHGIAHGNVRPSNMLVQSIEPLRIRLCDMRFDMHFDIGGNDSASGQRLSDYQRTCRTDIKDLGLLVLSWLTENDMDCYDAQVEGSKEQSWTALIRAMIEEDERLDYRAGKCLTDSWLCLSRPKKRRRSSEGFSCCNSEEIEPDRKQCRRIEPLSSGQLLYTMHRCTK